MAEKLTLLEVDASTGIEVIRELTADELADRQATKLAYEAEQVAKEEQIAASLSALDKLAELGLTEAEIAAL